MNKTALVLALMVGIVTAPLVAGAQPPGKIPRIGVLSSASASGPYARDFAAFRQGLRDLGYVEGQTILIEWRWAEGKYDRLPALAAELVQLKVDVIVTHGRGNFPAKQATSTIPIVSATIADPGESGLVASLARPGGNITGVGWFRTELMAKRLEVLKEAMPRVTRVAVLFNPDNPGTESWLNAMKHAAQALKVTLHPVGVRGPGEFEGAFAGVAARRVEALVVVEDAMIIVNQRRVAELAIKQRLPSMGMHEYPGYGGLLAYDANPVPMWSRAATFVDKILKGTRPGDLPVELTTKFDLVVNLKTAKALGLTIPPSVLLRADEVIE